MGEKNNNQNQQSGDIRPEGFLEWLSHETPIVQFVHLGFLAVVVFALIAWGGSVLSSCTAGKDSAPATFQGDIRMAGADKRYLAKDGNIDDAKQALYRACCERDETLASIMSAFPDILTEECGFSVSDPLSLQELLGDRTTSDDTRRDLLAKLQEILDGRHVLIGFEELSGQWQMLYPYLKDPSLPTSSSNIGLLWVPVQLNQALVLRLRVDYDANRYNEGIFDLSTGFQRIADTNFP